MKNSKNDVNGNQLKKLRSGLLLRNTYKLGAPCVTHDFHRVRSAVRTMAAAHAIGQTVAVTTPAHTFGIFALVRKRFTMVLCLQPLSSKRLQLRLLY